MPIRLVPRLRRLLDSGVRIASRGLPPVRSAPRGERSVTFLLWNAYAMGGTVRTVTRQAAALADRGVRVTIVSVLRHRSQPAPFFETHPSVTVECLVDRRALAARSGPFARLARWLDDRPNVLGHVSHGREPQASLLTDLAIVTRIARTRGVVVGTRMGLNIAVARFAHPSATTVVQEHLSLARYDAAVRRAAVRTFADVDVVACLTTHEADDYRAQLGGEGPAVLVIPNAIDDELPEASALSLPTVVSVGRLERGKGFHHLIDAFASLRDVHPGWQLRIVGEGRARRDLQAQIDELGLGDRVTLVGAVTDVDRELHGGSVFVCTSRFESFGLVLLEAMAVGLPIVSFEVPVGPRELLTHEREALLVPHGDVHALAQAMDRLMRDPELRGRLGGAGRRTATRYTLGPVTDRWEQALWPATSASRQRTRAGRAVHRPAAGSRLGAPDLH